MFFGGGDTAENFAFWFGKKTTIFMGLAFMVGATFYFGVINTPADRAKAQVHDSAVYQDDQFKSMQDLCDEGTAEGTAPTDNYNCPQYVMKEQGGPVVAGVTWKFYNGDTNKISSTPVHNW